MAYGKHVIGNQGASRPVQRSVHGQSQQQYGAYTYNHPQAHTRGLLQGTPGGAGNTGLGGFGFGGGGQQGFGGGGYPGFGGAGQQLPALQQPGMLPAATAPTAAGGGSGGGLLSTLGSLFGGGGSSAGGSGSSLNLAQIKNIVDRLGGVEGIVETFGKVQKVVQSVQQMAPMIKMLVGSFGKGRKAAAEGEDLPVRKRRRKRKTGSRPVAGKAKRRGRR